jgi:hypothetical protein
MKSVRYSVGPVVITNNTMKRAAVSLLIGILLGMSSLFAQSPCAAYEREMELYFYVYQPGERPQMRWVDQAWQQCSQPTAKMRLMYHYFKAMLALYQRQAVNPQSYRDASLHFDLASRHLPTLRDMPESDRNFATLYLDRYEALDKTLGAQAEVLSLSREQPLPALESDVWESEWAKEESLPSRSSAEAGRNTNYPAVPSVRSSGSTRPPSGYDKSYYYEDTYQSDDPWKYQSQAVAPNEQPPSRDRYREPYGQVGALQVISMREYLAWRGESSRGNPSSSYTSPSSPRRENLPLVGLEDLFATPEPSFRDYGNPRGANRAPSSQEKLAYASPTTGEKVEITIRKPSAWVDQLGQGYVPAANLYDPLPLRTTPNINAPVAQFVAFGEPMARANTGQVVVAAGMPFVQVRTKGGQAGWAELSALLDGGREAVLIEPTKAYAKATKNSNFSPLPMGELVVLAETKGNWVKVFTRNGEQELWVPSARSLSLNPVDIALAEYLLEASKMPTSDRVRKLMMSARSLEGFSSSPLSPLVEQQMR